MKRQHVLVLLVLVAALAVAIYQMTSSSGTKTDSSSDEVAVSSQTEEAVELKEKTAKDLPVEAAAVQPAAPEADATEESTTQLDAASSSPASEDVAVRIKQNLAGARKILQQKSAIEKARPEDVHHTPKATLDAARRLGEIAELEAQHPEQAESFREFYLECARDEDTITVTRAQCLDKYMKASKLNAAEQKLFLSDYPDEIVRLVEALQ
jgi:hypothetical protein